MNIFQSHQRNIPEQKDEKEKDQTGKDQQSNKDPLLWPVFQNVFSGVRGFLGSRVRVVIACPLEPWTP